jgi:predicted site-specific integrase-resolvase
VLNIYTDVINADPCRKGADMMNTAKSTILYSRLSKEDERENESLSIEHQRQYLEEYAQRNGLTNIVHLVDDGWSGTRWDRPGFLQMIDMVENGKVGQICIKDAYVKHTLTIQIILSKSIRIPNNRHGVHRLFVLSRMGSK